MKFWSNEDLNEEQEAAVLAEESVLLIACPGSGKTHTLTYKIAYEVSKLTSSKNFVVAITYTHRAAEEIKDRVESLGICTDNLWIGTIHSLCLEWILKPYSIYCDALKYGFHLIDNHEKEAVLDSICDQYKGSKVTHWDCEYYFENGGRVLGCTDSSKLPTVKKVIEQYFGYLANERKIDFEHLLFYALELISIQPQICSTLSKIFAIVLIDEYQDTKNIQYQILASILRAGSGSTRTFVVGDPNQSIYRSLGGYPIEKVEFERLSALDMKEMVLTKNYRSSRRIIEYFEHYNVYGNKIESCSEYRDFQSLISLNSAVDKTELSQELIRLIRHSIEECGIAMEEVCILAPQWVHLASMTRFLVTEMPEYQFDGPGMVPFSRDLDNFWYKLARIILTDASPTMYVKRLRWAKDILNELDAAGVSIHNLTNKLLLRECNSLHIEESDGLQYLSQCFEALFERLLVDFRIYPHLNSHYSAFFESSKSRIARLQKEGASFISETETFKRVFRERAGITVSTIHGVKGAEFDVVIAYALLEGMVPHFNDLDSESAARMLYVVGSRARKNLHLISERGRVRWRNGPEYPMTRTLEACKYTYDVF